MGKGCLKGVVPTWGSPRPTGPQLRIRLFCIRCHAGEALKVQAIRSLETMAQTAEAATAVEWRLVLRLAVFGAMMLLQGRSSIIALGGAKSLVGLLVFSSVICNSHKGHSFECARQLVCCAEVRPSDQADEMLTWKQTERCS